MDSVNAQGGREEEIMMMSNPDRIELIADKYIDGNVFPE